MTLRRPGAALSVVVAVILAVALLWSLVVVGYLTRLDSDAASPTAAGQSSMQAQGRPHGQVVEFREGEVTEVPPGADPGEPFIVGSVSKTFTAATTLRLADAGQLDIDAPVIRYLPWFSVGGNAGDSDDITVRMLLEQTSGIPTAAGIENLGDLDHVDTPARQRIEELSDVELVSAPGAEFHYSNSNYATLGLVLEEVSGLTYADLLEQEVVEPLELNRTNARGDGYGRDVTCGRLAFFGAGLPLCLPYDPYGGPEGYIVSNATDLASFMEALRTGPFLSDASRELMLQPEGGRDYGAGLFREDAVVYHPGDVTIVHADVGVDVGTGEGSVVLVDQAGQLFSSQAPFRVARFGEQPNDGGYRTVALVMVWLAALVAVAIAVDLLRRRTRPRGWGSVITRILIALLITVGLFWAAGQALGLSGVLPFLLGVAFAVDLVVIIVLAAGYLVVSALAVATGAIRGRNNSHRQ